MQKPRPTAPDQTVQDDRLDLLGDDEADYDQLIVNGFVDLDADENGGATLDVVLDPNEFCPGEGDTFTIIENDGIDFPSGEFRDKPDDGLFEVACGEDIVTFQISYAGGDGNDVELTATDVSPAPAPAAFEVAEAEAPIVEDPDALLL